MKRSARFIRAGVLLALLALATVASASASGSTTRTSANGIDPALVKRLKDNARGSVSVSVHESTAYADFVRAGQNGDLLPSERGNSRSAKAKAFLGEYGGLLGITDESQLAQSSVTTDKYGATHLSYKQVYKGVPVFGGDVRAHLDADNNLTAVNGVFVPGVDLNTTTKLSASEAAALAVAAVKADPPTNEETGKPADVGDVRAAKTTLYVYRTGLVRRVEGSNQLVYEVEVTDGAGVRDFVYVHAQVGKIVNRYSGVDNALYRRVYEQQFDNAHLVWQEGDPFPGSLTVDQQHIVTFTGDAYRHFFNAFGRDSYDGLGHIMNTVNNDPRINCPNANWNGITTNYCNGVTADDVVAHEWGHAYTEYTWGGIYQWQPGALNEAYSDIWGETVDQINGAGTDSPAPVRTVGSCSTHTTPVPILLINSPPAIAGECPAGAAQFGPPLTATGTTGNVVLALDGVGGADTSTTNGCTPPFTNAAQIAGNIALIDRGTCTFTTKVKNAQNAGAIAVVIANTANTLLTMSGGDPTITIPSLIITLNHGNMIKTQLSAGQTVNVTLKVKGGAAPREDSYRWLMGEDATAFNPTSPNHAIRDMWDPTCLADPGKVTDAEYQCDTSDAGGVHTNSGVPNHGYALLVDGGTYNSRTVTALGLTKAAHLYWRAQSVYQTRTSGFPEHADALEASCQDLIGVDLAALSTSASGPAGSSGQSITAADCVEVSDMIAAVELRTDPTAQCNFTPLLAKTPPQACGTQKKPDVLFRADDFGTTPAGWTISTQAVNAGATMPSWVGRGSLPAGRPGTALFAENTDGTCGGGASDVSGVTRATSPAITIPSTNVAPKLLFEHYVATEFTFDGGNVKVSINGGAFAIVPASAFQYNPYNTTLAPAPGNTNPLAGEAAFSGSDGGRVFGSWGESQIDLTKIGVKPGDTIRFRLDFGQDGCSNLDGWYVDDIKVVACKAAPTASFLSSCGGFWLVSAQGVGGAPATSPLPLLRPEAVGREYALA